MKKLKLKTKMFTIVLSIIFILGSTFTALASTDYYYYGSDVYIGDRLVAEVGTYTSWDGNDNGVYLHDYYLSFDPQETSIVSE